MITAPKITSASHPSMEETDRLIQGVFEPPSGAVMSAIARHKAIVAVVAVICALLGAGYGLSRRPTYTASTTLQVGQVNPNSAGFNGYVQSAAALATAFSRAIAAEPVLDAVRQKLDVSPSQAASRLSAEPIPASPAFRIIATGSTASAAVQLANTASSAVIAYEGQSNNTNPEASSLLREYQEASLSLRRAVAVVSQRSRRKRGYSGALASAEAERNAAEIKLHAIGVAYTSAIASRAPSSGLVALVAGATSAASDHSSKAQKYGLVGLLAGILIACASVTLLERRRAGRAPTVEVEIQRSQEI